MDLRLDLSWNPIDANPTSTSGTFPVPSLILRCCLLRGFFPLNSTFWSSPSWGAKTIGCCTCGSWFHALGDAVTSREVLSLVAVSGLGNLSRTEVWA